MVAQIFYTVEHILLQYNRAEIYIYIFYCYIVLVKWLILQGLFVNVTYFCTLSNQSYQSNNSWKAAAVVLLGPLAKIKVYVLHIWF